jgi:5-enolpyruvylshikimate-3-phosphate synthase
VRHETLRPDGIVHAVAGRSAAGTIDSRGDHRIAMAFAVASLRASAPRSRSLDCANVATSFPNFAALAQQAGLGIRVENADG